MTTIPDKGRWAAAAVTVAAALILAIVYVAQYGFDLWPCTLCYGQRVPYFLVAVFGALSLMPAVDSRARRLILFHLAALFLLAAALALYHVGVEQHWWQGPKGCTGGGNRAISMEDLLSALSKPGQPGCDQIAFSFAGISLAGYNLIAALSLFAASLFAALRKPWWSAP